MSRADRAVFPRIANPLALSTLAVALLLTASLERAARASERGDDRFVSNVRQLTFEGRRSGECYFSPDGQKLVFMSEREEGNPFFQIYELDFESGDVRRVSTGKGKTTCPFYQAGTGYIEYASTHLDPNFEQEARAEYERREKGQPRRGAWDYDEKFDIFLARPDGTILKQLTDARGYDAEGAFSPDGSKIVFCSMRDAYPPEQLSEQDRETFGRQPEYFAEIYIMNADGSGQQRLTDWPGYDGGPFFTPDGQRIVWRHFTEDGLLADVYTMKLDGSDRRRLTEFRAMSWAPFFHPSGKYCVFTTNKLGFDNFELFAVDDLGAHEPVRVTYTQGFDGLGVFSPDGRKLVWTSNDTGTGQSQIFLADWDHEAALEAIQAAPRRGAGADDPRAASAGTGAGVAVAAAVKPEASVADLKAEVEFLAADANEGRLTGSAGAAAAARFIANVFKNARLSPAKGEGSDAYYLAFEFDAGVKLKEGQNRLAIVGDAESTETNAAQPERDFRPLTYSGNGEAEGEVIFAGYGIVEPDSGSRGYNSYAGIDVKGKIVLVLRDLPEEIDPQRRQELALYSGDRYKAKLAADHGARAFLLVSGPNSADAGQLIPFRENDRTAAVGIPALSISGELADRLLEPGGEQLKTLQTALDGGQLDPHAHRVVGAKVRLSAGLERVTGDCRNVVALVPPAGGCDEYVAVGAHFDHLGHGESSSSLARGEEREQTHNGADDNASGTAVVLELAADLAEKFGSTDSSQPRRGLLFCCWSGEELGLVGSSAFVNDPPVPLEKIVAYLNFDMVGRLSDNKLIVQGVGSSPQWRKLLERRNVAAGFSLALTDDPYLPTDSTVFYTNGVPTVNFFTGLHDDYHRPSDDADKLNYEGMERIVGFAARLVSDLAKPSFDVEYNRIERSRPSGDTRGRRTYTGVVPDFAANTTDGMMVSDVRAGGPAEKAGIRGGDKIVEFAGKKINGLQDYADALRGVKIGEPVEVVVVRDGKELRLTMTPEASPSD